MSAMTNPGIPAHELIGAHEPIGSGMFVVVIAILPL